MKKDKDKEETKKHKSNCSYYFGNGLGSCNCGFDSPQPSEEGIMLNTITKLGDKFGEMADMLKNRKVATELPQWEEEKRKEWMKEFGLKIIPQKELLWCKIFGHKYADRYFRNGEYVVNFYNKCVNCGRPKLPDDGLEIWKSEHDHD